MAVHIVGQSCHYKSKTRYAYYLQEPSQKVLEHPVTWKILYHQVIVNLRIVLIHITRIDLKIMYNRIHTKSMQRFDESVQKLRP